MGNFKFNMQISKAVLLLIGSADAWAPALQGGNAPVNCASKANC